MDNKIDQLKTEVDGIKNSLNELKNNVSLSEEEKKTQADALKSQAEAAKQKVENEIRLLESKTDDDSKKAKDEAEALLTTINETMALYTSILSTGSTNTPSTDPETKDAEKKSFFGRAGARIGEQWDVMWDKDKRLDEDKRKNALRVAGFAATGVGAIALAVKGIKKLFGKDKEEKKESESGSDGEESNSKKEEEKKSSWWKKGLAALGIGTAGLLGYKYRDKIKAFFEREKPLTFEEALKSATSEVRNGKIKENPFRQHFEGGIMYDTGKGVIKSYGEEIKVDVYNKTIEGLSNIKFPDYKQLIHAANIINFARRNFAGKCQSDTPFEISDEVHGGDLVVHLANGEKPEWIGASDSSLWTKILGASGCAIGTAVGAYIGGIKGAAGLGATLGLGGAAVGDYLDNNSSMGNTTHIVDSGRNLERFKICLNDQKDSSGNSIWPQKSQQEINPDDSSPIEVELNEVINEIYLSEGEGTGGRNLRCEQNKENPEIFTIYSYHEKVDIILKGCNETGNQHIDYSKISGIKIGKYMESDWGDGLDIDFPHNKEGLKECIRVANLTNFIRGNNEYAGNGGEKYPFVYGKYPTPSHNLDMDTLGVGGIAVLSHNTLKTKFPTIFQDVKKQVRKTDQDKLEQQAKGKDDIEGYGSRYIKYLHQMRNEHDSQSYWFNGQQN